MGKNSIPEMEPGSQIRTKKSPDISHLTGIKDSFHFKKEKARFRIYFITIRFHPAIVFYPVNKTAEKIKNNFRHCSIGWYTPDFKLETKICLYHLEMPTNFEAHGGQRL